MAAKVAPYGSWRSPISPEMVSQGGMSSRGTLRDLFISQGVVYWRQLRSDQDGRYDLLYLNPAGQVESILPMEYSVSTKVHEYGGGAFFIHHGWVFFSNEDDQRIYRMRPSARPEPITPAPQEPKSIRYADGRGQPVGNWLVSVQELHHADGNIENRLVALLDDGSQKPEPIAQGHDFYANPRFNEAGDQLLWLTWDHPNMPWDGTELWMAEFNEHGKLSGTVKIAGGPEESLFQPAWGPDGSIYFISDRSGWWNLYRWDEEEIAPVTQMKAEVGTPAWNFGFSRFDFLAEGKIALIFTQNGFDTLAIIEDGGDAPSPIELPFTAYYPAYLRSDGKNQLWFLASSPTKPQALYQLNLINTQLRVVQQPVTTEVDIGYIAGVEAISFPTGDNERAHAFLYPPRNKDYAGLPKELPPLIIMIHGGPTSAAVPQIHLEKQFWTSRGFMVADINYRGSTGYGRTYREKLKGQWGVADVEDCVNLARYLAEAGHVDPDRLIIRGSSAGGYATLAALALYDTFDAGASYYGVADVEALAKLTHKFEAHYLDSLIGPYPEAAEIYRQRSPINHKDGLSSPLILFQGEEDKVVPPEQARQLVQVLEEKKLPYAYFEFPGESHGFSKQSTVVRALSAELYFYSRIFGYQLEESVEPIIIHYLKDL